MENKNNQAPPPETEAAPPKSAPSPRRNNSGDHISLSSPADSYSSPLHSKHNSDDHISLSPPDQNSPDSAHITISNSRGSSPEHETNRPMDRSSPESEYIAFDHGRGSGVEEHRPAAVVVRKDMYKGPMEDMVVVEEPMAAVVNRAVMEEPNVVAPKPDPGPELAGGGGGSGIRRRRVSPSLSILRRGEREKMVRKAALGFRVFGLLFCLISFAVMAADRNQGWALDSFDRYKEFRYCMSVNVIGFVYSGAQALDMSYNLVTGKYIVHQQPKLRHYLNFAADQMIAYLLISASSSATIRIDDWQLNWGKDQFPDLATASVSMSFLAFVALAMSSLISGYVLCTSKTA